jgi:hypothetical protein
MSKVCVKTKNSKNKIVIRSDIAAGFAGDMLLSTEILQRNAEKHQDGGLEIVRINKQSNITSSYHVCRKTSYHAW